MIRALHAVTLGVAAAILLLAAPFAEAGSFVLINLDGAGEGFNDPTPVSPIGGNPGTTLGQQRLNVFQTAGKIWGAYIPDNVTIRVEARFDPLTPCDSVSGVLGSAGAITLASDFAGAPLASTWYPIALANKLAGTDLATTVNDITAHFNSSVDNSTCLGTSGWYYGYDHNEGTNIDLLAVVLHELSHGLGFQTFTNLSTGGFQNGKPDVYARHLFDRTLNEHWDQMTSNQRSNSAVNTGNLVWDGSFVTNAAHLFLGPAAIVRIDSPAVIAGEKDYGTADFGAPPPNPPLQGQVVLVNDGVGTTSDACEPIVNGAQIAGKIALIDRGTCTFVAKAAAAQAAGAIAVIIGNNVAGAPPGMTGVDPSVTIPVVSITQADATAIKGQLGVGVFATIGIDAAHLAGTDTQGRVKLYAPNPLESGSNVSHFDVSATPNLLEEPFINSDLTDSPDLNQYLFADIGWWTGAAAVATAQAAGAPRAFSAPNPFSAGTAIRFSLARSGKTDVAVFDARGALVKRLASSWRPAGAQRVEWDGTDASGGRAPAGVYYWRVTSEEAPQTGRVVRIP
ncbi:MAG TPA: PA domain-containing protein [Candidatus Eisenbacteria bacterium]|nr:PA domain-containing protein [Candidatus Eisenbacteria bacterium]